MINALSYKDIYYTTSATSLNYKIYAKGDVYSVIYAGLARRSPGSNVLGINISKIIRNYLNTSMTDIKNLPSYMVFENTGSFMRFMLTSDITESGVTEEVVLEEYYVLLSSDYGDTWDGSHKLMTDTINGHADSRQLGFMTVYNPVPTETEILIGFEDFYYDLIGSKEFDFSSQTREYSVDCTNFKYLSAGTTDSWFTVTKTATGITLEVDENSGTTERIGTILISWPGADLEPAYGAVLITQDREHFNAEFSGTFEYPYSATSGMVSFVADAEPDLVSYPSWFETCNIFKVATSAYMGTIVFTFNQQSYSGERNGNIVLRRKDFPNGETASCEIKQGEFVWEYSLDESAITLDYYSDTRYMGFTTNGPASAITYVCPSWATAVTSGDSIAVTVGDYSGSTYRSGSIQIVTNWPEYQVLDTLTVVQDNFYFEFVDPSQEHIATDYAEKIITVPVRTNARQVVVSGDSQWMAGYYSNSNIVLEIDYNTTDSARTGNTYVYSDISNVPISSITIQQSENIYLISYFTMEMMEDGKFAVITNSSSSSYKKYYYRINEGEWTEKSADGAGTIYYVDTLSGDTIEIKGPLKAPVIYCNCSFNTYGNIMSLGYGDDFIGVYDLNKPIGAIDRRDQDPGVRFGSLFENADKIQSAENLMLPATVLKSDCYHYMFRDCTSLTAVPKLPATTLASGCYSGMFFGCSALVNAPELPATTLASGCYSQMFRYCTSLTTSPELPATTLEDNCYSGMFWGCTALVNPSELQSTTLADSCYKYMFSGCTSLVNVPELQATALADDCYYGMFGDCSSITTAPELPAATLSSGSYGYMFAGCTSLNYVKCLAVNITVGYQKCTYHWLKDVSQTGTFVKKTGAPWSIGDSDIPAGWTVEEV